MDIEKARHLISKVRLLSTVWRLPGGSLFVYVRQVREHLYFLEERDAELRTGCEAG